MRKHARPQTGLLDSRALVAVGVVLAALVLTDQALAAAASLSFEERVAGQRAIEEVYWRHRTPTDNTSAKPPLSQVLPEAALREKVTDALRMSNALATIWKQPITGEQLQAEIDRMAAASKQPAMLREIWAALGNDPHLIAECLARPQVADRLMRDHYSNDPRFNAAPRTSAHADRTKYGTVGEMRQMSGTYKVARFTRAAPSETATAMQLSATQFDAMIQEIAGAFGVGGGLPRPREDGRPFDRSPAAGARPMDEIPLGRVSDVLEDANRFSVVAVLARDQDHIQLASVEWPKVSFDAWWQSVRDTITPQVDEPQRGYRIRAVSSGGDGSSPAASAATDEWRPIAGMDFRVLGLHVWTGSEMIVWGGWSRKDFAGNPHTDGGRYDPATDTWRPISVIGAPTSRMLGVVSQPVWTGKEMIVWGGFDPVSGDNYNNGARYNPATDTWTPMSTVGAPVPRDSFSIVWTGTEMIVWGGWNGHDEYRPWFLNSGGRYNPETDTWRPTSTGPGCPSTRQHHVAVWTGTRMIVWGGIGWLLVEPETGTNDLNDGGVYDPQTDTWTLTGTSLVGAPTDRYYPTAVWTGTEMIIWGGRGATGTTGSGGYDSAGGRYNPATDTWQPTSTVNVPGKRKYHFAVWTGTDMLVWGGDGPGPDNQNGGRYNPVTDTWVTMNQNGQPPLSYWLNGVWTGSEMLVWGGTGRDDGRYNPATDTWRPMNTPVISQQYDGPYGHSAVWTGSEMIIWGGRSGNGTAPQNIGGVYVPSTDTWRLTTTVGAPDPRYSHTAVWTGSEMIVWGGTGGVNTGNTGARYNPATDTWTVTSVTASTPPKRGGHTVVWTGSEMIVWGGRDGSTATNSGGRYDPATDAWQPTSTIDAPSARYSHSAVWSGSTMVIWGGGTSTATATGARYDPATDAWQPTSATDAPSARSSHTAIWTGTRMIVWGGGSYSGGRYDPATDAWQPMSASGYSGGVVGNTAIWTGNEMIAWGGGNSGGGRYDPAADTWQPTSIPRFLPGRLDHSAVWTRSSMIVFGGYPMTTTGAAYTLAPAVSVPESDRPFLLTLRGATPNPFRSTARLIYALPAAGRVSLRIVDVQGRQVEPLVAAWQEAGEHELVWNARARPPGLYFAILSSGGVTRAQRLIHLR